MSFRNESVYTEVKYLDLPHRGELLQPGYQYRIPPLARAMVRDEYGFQIPEVCICLHKKSSETIITTFIANVDEGTVLETTQRNEARLATFYFYSHARKTLFTLDCAVVHDAEQRRRDAEKVKEAHEKATPKPKKTKEVVFVDLAALGL